MYEFNVHAGNLESFDDITVRQTMHDMGTFLNFKHKAINWNGIEISMKRPNELVNKEHLFVTFKCSRF